MQDSSASKEDICTTIASLPCQLSAEDVDDFFSLAQYYAARTPQSFRKVGVGKGVWCITACGCGWIKVGVACWCEHLQKGGMWSMR